MKDSLPARIDILRICSGLRHITQFFFEIEQTGFVFDDGVVSMEHEGYLSKFDWIRHPLSNW